MARNRSEQGPTVLARRVSRYLPSGFDRLFWLWLVHDPSQDAAYIYYQSSVHSPKNFSRRIYRSLAEARAKFDSLDVFYSWSDLRGFDSDHFSGGAYKAHTYLNHDGRFPESIDAAEPQ